MKLQTAEFKENKEAFTSVEQIKYRGRDAITLCVKANEDILIMNCNEFGKSIGVNKTRNDFLKDTDVKDVINYVNFCDSSTEKDLKEEWNKRGLMSLTERVFRGHITTGFAKDYRKNMKLRIKLLGMQGAIDSIMSYVTSERTVPTAETFKEFSQELDAKEIMFFEPKDWSKA